MKNIRMLGVFLERENEEIKCFVEVHKSQEFTRKEKKFVKSNSRSKPLTLMRNIPWNQISSRLQN